MSRPRQVLYVEDNEQNRRLVERVLRAAGWEVRAVENGHQALEELAGSPPPDLVLMDLAMPVLDGYQTTARLRRDPRLCWLPVVAITAHAMVGDEERAREAGCDGYLTKPFDVRTLVETLEGYLVELEARRPVRHLEGVLRLLEDAASGEDPPPGSFESAAHCLEELLERLRG